MSTNWKAAWDAHPDVFLTREWQECPADKRKSWRLPAQFSYFWGGETALRIGIIASDTLPREEDFLLAGVQFANRLSNGARTVIYFVAPNFSPYFLYSISKIGFNINARAVYWRERLKPSLYLIPEGIRPTNPISSIGEARPNWSQWAQELNPVSRQELEVVRRFFDQYKERGVRYELRHQSIAFLWGNIEIAEIRRKGKKIELSGKGKWDKHKDQQQWTKPGWVDSSGSLNADFCVMFEHMLNRLEEMAQNGELRPIDLLAWKLYNHGGIWNSIWGKPLNCPWLSKGRKDNWVNELNKWFYFEANGQLSIICPILDKPLLEGSQSIILSSVLEKSMIMGLVKNDQGEPIHWDGIIHWLTIPEHEEDLLRWHGWLKDPDQFKIWVLPKEWERKEISELSSRGLVANYSWLNQ